MLLSRPGVVLMYGERYDAVVLALRVMIVVGGLTMGEAAFNALLSTTDNQRMRVVFACLSLVVTAGFAFTLVLMAVLAFALSMLTRMVVEGTSEPDPHLPTIIVWFVLCVLLIGGPMVRGSQGQPVVHPGLTEARGQRAILHRLIAALRLPDEDGAAVPTGRQIGSVAANAARWAGHRKEA